MVKSRVSALIIDLDNTLYDWMEYWYTSFRAMLDEILRISGISEEDLLPQIRKVHQRHGTSEYAFLIQELPSLQEKHHGADLKEIYASAIQAYRSARRKSLNLYPGVYDTLIAIKNRGCLIAAYTESLAYHSIDRIKRFNLDGIVGYLYTPKDHDFPIDTKPEDFRMYPAEHYRLQHSKHLVTPPGIFKPDPIVLNEIINSLQIRKDKAIYVGDSLMKDIQMAQSSRIKDVLAKYGESRDREEYKLLRQVSHWQEAAVQLEQTQKIRSIKATYILRNSFSELLDLFEFEPHGIKDANGREINS